MTAAAVWRLAALLIAGWLLSALDSRRAEANGEEVDLALVLGVDVSRSVDRGEYELQRRGLAEALRSPQVVDAIRSGRVRKVAVTVVQWTDYKSQVIVVPWTVVSDMQSAVRFSNRVATMVRFFGGMGTHVAGMIEFGTWHIESSPFTAARKVIDISGDGYDNVTQAPGRHRDAAIARGITINGLVIENEEMDLHLYFREFVIGGPGAFVMRAARYEDFGKAMEKKLIREISPKFLTFDAAGIGPG